MDYSVSDELVAEIAIRNVLHSDKSASPTRRLSCRVEQSSPTPSESKSPSLMITLIPPSFRNQCKVTRSSSNEMKKLRESDSILHESDRISNNELLLTPEERRRIDEQNDALFYSVPRFIQYVDENFRQQLTIWYSTILQEGWSVLDLCSGYDSHLPAIQFSKVTGLGMSTPELAANSALTDYFVKDLNSDPQIPSPDDCYDAVLCCMGLQYLKFPEEICKELLRVLKPGGKVLISYTSHCFPEKTLTGWLERTLDERLEMVSKLLKNAGFENVENISQNSNPNSPDVVSDSVLPGSFQNHSQDDENSIQAPTTNDPFYANLASKPITPCNSNASDLNSLLTGSNHTRKKSKVWQLCTQWDRLLVSHSKVCDRAMSIGIPETSLLFPDEKDTLQSLTKKRDHIRGIIASFVSSGL